MNSCIHVSRTYIGSLVGYGIKIFVCDDCRQLIAEENAVAKLQREKRG